MLVHDVRILALLPAVGLLIAIFAGWKLDLATRWDELGMRRLWTFNIWQWLLRYLVPAAVVTILAISAWGFVSSLSLFPSFRNLFA